MFRNTNRKTVLVVALLMVIGGSTAFAVVQSSNVRNPEDIAAQAPLPPPIPFLAPPETEAYRSQQTGTNVVAPDQRPVAQLDTVPSDLNEVLEVNFPMGDAPGPDEVAYTILSSVRYSGKGRTVLVTTAHPSIAATQQTVTFGNQTIQLANGTQAWITTDLPYKTSNQLVFIADDLIITVASDLPVEQIKQLAARVTVNR